MVFTKGYTKEVVWAWAQVDEVDEVAGSGEDRASEVAASLEDSLLATTGGLLARIAPEGSPWLAMTV